MAIRLTASDPDFEARFTAFLAAKRETSAEVDATVRAIVADVRDNGDRALLAYTRRFDRHDLTPDRLRIRPEAIETAMKQADAKLVEALTLARDRIEAFHRRQRPQDDLYVDPLGVELGTRWTALDAVGIYVPGGTASYPSSVLMNAVPAKVAGVERIAMVVPSPQGRLNPLVLVAARLAGVDEIFRVGGAQAIAALAYGTETIAPVAKIVGPGNAFVAAAKRHVHGHVGIDMIAGPSEVLVVADAENDADWIAADLLAQAEHDPAAQAILVTDDPDLAWSVEAAVERQLATLPRAEAARASWREFGAIIVVESLGEAPPLVNRIAPEHLELAVADPLALLAAVRNAGAVFLGRHTPEAIGDYVAGPNHVLPTARSARFSSGLSVLDFMKRTTLLRLDADSLRALAPAALALAEAEGFHAHGRSISIRLNA
jgi:histidinol dehydrogenase